MAGQHPARSARSAGFARQIGKDCARPKPKPNLHPRITSRFRVRSYPKSAPIPVLRSDNRSPQFPSKVYKSFVLHNLYQFGQEDRKLTPDLEAVPDTGRGLAIRHFCRPYQYRKRHRRNKAPDISIKTGLWAAPITYRRPVAPRATIPPVRNGPSSAAIAPEPAATSGRHCGSRPAETLKSP